MVKAMSLSVINFLNQVAVAVFFLGLLIVAIVSGNPIDFVTNDGKLSNLQSVSDLMTKKIILPSESVSKNSVRIIGSAGSKGCGKSTLLNRLYGCDLQVNKQLNNGKISGGNRGMMVTTGSTKHDIIGKKSTPSTTKTDSLGEEGSTIETTSTTSVKEADLLVLDSNMMDFRDDDASNSVAGKTLAFTGRLCDALIYNIWTNEVGRKGALKAAPLELLYQEALIKYDQEEKQNSNKDNNNNNEENDSSSPETLTKNTLNEKTLLVVAVHDYTKLDDSEEELSKLKTSVKQNFINIWTSIPKPRNLGKKAKKLGFSDLFDIEVVTLPNPIRQAAEYNEALVGLKEIIDKNINNLSISQIDGSKCSYSKAIHKDGLKKMTKEWNNIISRDVTLLPSRIQMTSYFAIDALFNKFNNAIDKRINEWRYIVDSGDIIPKFGEQATNIYIKSLDAFAKATQPYSLGRARLLKYKALKEKLTKNLEELVTKQVATLQQTAMKKYKNGIIPFVNGEKREESEGLIQSKIEQWFTTQVNTLLIPDIYPVNEKSVTELTTMIQDFASKWPGSPTYNVVAMKNLEKNSKKKKGKPGVSFGCQLVSLLRFSGMGNFQGYGTYNAGPVQFIFGAQNDRDLPDSTGTGIPPPWLKLQPKVSVDVDM